MPKPRKSEEFKRARRKTYNKTWHEAHRDEVLARQKTYTIAHRKEIAARQKAWGVANRDKKRDRMLKRNYGLTIKTFNDLLASQAEKCAVCGKQEWGRGGPVVNHNHKTGNVRGILCGRCNMAAGLLRDDPERARLLSDYLKEK